MFRISLIVAAACLSTGCASIVSGNKQSIQVTTQSNGADVAGARCKLVNDKGIWFTTTPGTVHVQRSFKDLALSCTLEGVEPGLATIKSSTKAIAFGNILFGGLIGATVDMSTGAAYIYPELIKVELGKPAAAAPEQQADKATQAKQPAADAMAMRQDPPAAPK